MTHSHPENDTPETNVENVLPMGNEDDEYEVITSDEVDNTLEVLDQLIEASTSENIRSILEEAAEQIYTLVYDEEQAEEAA